MNNAKLSILLKLSIILIGVCGLSICVLWYPYSISLTSVGSIMHGTVNTTMFWCQLSFYWATSIPCFYILVMCWKIVNKFRTQDTIFEIKFSNDFMKISKILLIDNGLFFIGNIVFVCLGWNVFAILYLMLSVICIAICVAMYFLAKIINDGIKYKEESDGTI